MHEVRSSGRRERWKDIQRCSRRASLHAGSGDVYLSNTHSCDDVERVLALRSTAGEIVRDVLMRTTSPPPVGYLTLAEVVALRECCAQRAAAAHIDNYDVHASSARASACHHCTEQVLGHE